MSGVPPTSLIIGAGLMGRHHAQCAAKAGARIAGIVDHDLMAAEKLAARHGGAGCWSTLDEGLAASGATVAHVCTPQETHSDIALALAGTGLNALIEKPLAETAPQAHIVHESFARAGRIACPVHQYAFGRGVRAASARLPQLGALRSVAFEICSAGSASGRVSPDQLIAEILPHPLSILQALLPSIDVSGLGWTCTRAEAGEWLVSAPWQGVMLTMALSASGRPTRFLSRLTAERGSIEIDHFHDFAVILPGAVSRMRKILGPFTRSGRILATASVNLMTRAARGEFAYPGLRALIAEFYAAAGRPGSAPPITVTQSLAVALARDAIVRSAGG